MALSFIPEQPDAGAGRTCGAQRRRIAIEVREPLEAGAPLLCGKSLQGLFKGRVGADPVNTLSFKIYS